MHFFTDHPSRVNESYCTHFRYACKTGLKLLSYSMVAFVHAIFPFSFETYVSDNVLDMAASMQQRRSELCSHKE